MTVRNTEPGTGTTRCAPWRHVWAIKHVSPPLWDSTARGILKTCQRCGKVVAK